MPSTEPEPSDGASTEYSTEEIGQMLFDIKARLANTEKKLLTNRFDHEAFQRQQTQFNKNMDDNFAKLLLAVENNNRRPTDSTAPPPTTRGWQLPASITTQPASFDADTWPKLKLDPPRFDGLNVTRWITRIQKYYNHSFTPLADRLYLTEFLLDDAAAEWFGYWTSNNEGKTWDDFLLDAKLRFDPDLYEDYVGRLASLRQTGSLDTYLSDFEAVLSKVGNVGDTTLTSLFIAGLQPNLKADLLTRRPASLCEAMAVARQLATAQHSHSVIPTTPSRSLAPREPQPQPKYTPPHVRTSDTTRTPPPTGRQPREGPPKEYPIIRVSAAERAEEMKRGECFWCPEKYSRSHVCSKRFYALMGADDDDEELVEVADPDSDEEAENMLIIGDVSTLHALNPTLRPRSIRLTGHVSHFPLSVLIDGGSTHNFIKPAIAEKLSLPVQSISPFRVFVGNGASLRCTCACLNTPIVLQGHHFSIDLYVLPVEGPDIILGVQWLQELGEVTKNYRTLSMRFMWQNKSIVLQGEDSPPKSVSYHGLLTLLVSDPSAELYEIVPTTVHPSPTADAAATLVPQLQPLLDTFAAIFSEPTGLPPPRRWDHKIHLAKDSKPVNVRPYRYPYFQKTEIERQVRDMLTQGVIQHSTSAFSSPVLLVRKKDGSFRFCVDYRALNAATTPDHFPIPTADELFDELYAAKVFSKLDLRSGYHQIRMHIDDIHKTAFRTHDGHFEFLVMPFGLTNAPSTFQAAMNAIFNELLRKFVIVFFDDILVYSANMDQHAQHLQQVFQILQDNSFFLKRSKCAFGVSEIEYLGHIISGGELRADDSKIAAMLAWLQPTSAKLLRGFLGLTGYYRRFVKNYSLIAAPLTDLLKKDNFAWTPTASASFAELKAAMSSTPVLRLPDFSSPFVVETDASDFGICAVLLQNGHPIAYFSKKLGPRRRLSSTYHKELYAIVEAVQKWRQYLLGREFIIRSDQRSLKELLSQVIQTPDQQFYVRKLMGFKFSIEYKSGASNKVADALSRRDDESEATSLFAMFCRPSPAIMDLLRSETATLPDLQELQKRVVDKRGPAHISAADGLLFFKTRIYLSRASAARAAILDECHSSPTAGHPGEKRTFSRVATTFYWPGMRRDIRKFVAACFTCQTTKYVRDKPNGLIQPLPIPNAVWEAASMDFIVGLPPSNGYTAIMVVVDRLSKYVHFGALKPGFDATRVARLFVDTIVKLHGFPSKLLSDRDPIFMSEFWTELLSLSGTKLQFTTAYHPQIDGQTEVTNRALEQYLRAFTHDRPNRWFSLLPWAELALNCSVNASIGMSPFQALYGRPPPDLFRTYSRPANNPSVRELLEERESTLRTLKQRIQRAQHAMAASANQHRKDVEFAVGDMVLLRLQPYRQGSLAKPHSHKLGQRFFGPYEIVERIGKVAYRLRLPVDSRIHDVFHVSLLRPFVRATDAEVPLPPAFSRHRPLDTPIRASDRRVVLVNRIPQEQWLVHWSSAKPLPPTWEATSFLREHFPHLHLEDKVSPMGGGVDTDVNHASPHEPTPATSPSPRREDTAIDAQNQPPANQQNPRPMRTRSKPSKYQDYISY